METGHDTVATRLPTRVASWPSDVELLTALAPWMYERRWYPLKDDGAPAPESMTVIANVELAPHVRDLLIAVTRPPSPAADGMDDGAVAAAAPVLIHVPLVLENAEAIGSFALPGEATAAAGFLLPPPPADVATPAEAGRRVALVDGAHHPAFWAAWAEGALRSGNALNEADTRAIFERSGRARVMTGEQSNTNVVMRAPAGSGTPDLVVKLFRVLSPGPNPDVEVSLALAAHGWDRVRRPVAWSTLSWVDACSGNEVSAHSAVATTFIPEAHDGFELFCALAAEDAAQKMIMERAGSAAASGFETSPHEHSGTEHYGAGSSSTGRLATGHDIPQEAQFCLARRRAIALARDLGATTAQMHRILALACGEHEPDSPAHFADTLRQRAAWALEEVPALHEQIPGLAGKIARVYARIDAFSTLEPATRIHGDYHLGQVLREKIAGEDAGADSDSGRWFVLDFEGEPLRPLAQRLLPDQPLRDVAGMLRSFDYAAAVGTAQAASLHAHGAGHHHREEADADSPDSHTPVDAVPAEDTLTGSDWRTAVRHAFIEGYESARPVTSDSAAPAEHDTHTASLTFSAEKQRALVNALELDKALYEAVYEARNRPDWLHIPLQAISRLLTG